VQQINNPVNIRLFGQIVLSFANASTTDEACYNLFDLAKEAFGFSRQFSHRARKEFPSLSLFLSSLTRNERIFIKLLIQERKILDFLNDQFGLINIRVDDYDFIKQSLSLRDIRVHASLEDGKLNSDIEYSSSYELNVDDISVEDWQVMDKKTKNELNKIFIVGQNIKKINQTVRGKKDQYSKKIAPYLQILRLHNSINEMQNKVKYVLNKIVKRKNLFNDPIFNELLKLYNAEFDPLLEIHSDGSITESNPITEEDFFESWLGLPPPHDETPITIFHDHPYKRILLYSLIEFLRGEEKRNLIICDGCGKFDVKERVPKKGTKTYCKVCSPKNKMSKEKRREYQKKRRLREKQKKDKLRLDDRINNLMKRTGFSREEVIEIIKADLKV
jgi:hypothetical protein